MNKSYIKCEEVYITERHSCAVTATKVKPDDPTKILETRKEYHFVRPTQPVYLEAGLTSDKESIDGEIHFDSYTDQYMFMPFDTTNAPISSEDLRMIANELDNLNGR